KTSSASVGHLGRGHCLDVALRSIGDGLRRCTRRLRCLSLLGSERLFSGGMSSVGLVELFLIVVVAVALVFILDGVVRVQLDDLGRFGGLRARRSLGRNGLLPGGLGGRASLPWRDIDGGRR